MKRSRFAEEQIIAVLREQEAGVSTAEVCRKHGVSSATFYKNEPRRRQISRNRHQANRSPANALPLSDRLPRSKEPAIKTQIRP